MHGENNMRSIVPVSAILFSLALLQSGAARAISVGQIDTFEDGTLQGWQMGLSSVTDSYMTNIADGGPVGVDDSYLEVSSDSTVRFGGKRLTFFNQLQWTGDYTAAGITAIAMDLKNLSVSEVLNLRLAINGGFGPSSNMTGGVFATSASASLDIGSDWTRVVFSLLPGDLVSVSSPGGHTTGNDVQATLANVLELRLLNSATPDWTGLPVTARLGIDNIQAVPLPPALALFASGLVVLLTKGRKNNLQT
jgi:hypothetical protein